MAKILIVDDKKINLLALQQVLKAMEEEVDIITAMTGDEALRASLNHDFALAILDVQMPAMDGYELADLMRSDPRSRHIPIIFLSAVYFDDPYVFKGYSSGAVDFITKPFNPEILRSKVRVFLELNARKAELIRKNADLEDMVTRLEEQIQARKKAEQELFKVRMLESIGTLAGGIAHDFNNMLTVLTGQIELAQIHCHDTERVHSLLDDALKAIFRATELTAKFVTFSGGGTPLKQEVAPNSLLREFVASALGDAQLKVDFTIPEELWHIAADPRQLKQVVYVVVNNAWEAMADNGGRLGVQALNWEHSTEKDATDPVLKKGRYVKVSFIDQGPGIDAQHLGKIFDPYFSTKRRGSVKGMGLGLTIAHSIMTRHGGAIQAESPPGDGARFHLYLPAANDP
ncbi:MAG: response regulator [Desulfobacteraceae bacterium]